MDILFVVHYLLGKTDTVLDFSNRQSRWSIIQLIKLKVVNFAVSLNLDRIIENSISVIQVIIDCNFIGKVLIFQQKILVLKIVLSKVFVLLLQVLVLVRCLVDDFVKQKIKLVINFYVLINSRKNSQVFEDFLPAWITLEVILFLPSIKD